MRRALVALPAMAVLLAACSEGSARDPGVRHRAQATTGSAADATIIDTAVPGDGSAADATIIDAVVPGDGSGTDATLPDAAVPGDGSAADAAIDAAVPGDGSAADAAIDAAVPGDGSGGDGGTSSALISVMPQAIDAGDVPVNSPSSQMLTVKNSGTAALAFSLTLPSLVPEWTAPGSTCIAPAQCMVPANGSMPVTLQFLPTTAGTVSSTVLITSNAANASSLSVPVTGRGVGSRITVAVPTNGVVDFGTIPRNSTTSQMLTASAIGNRTVTLDASDPGAPFSAAPAQLSLTPGVPGTLTVSCGSPTATGPVAKTLALGSPDAYAVDPTSVMLRCVVANTQVSVAPNQFDFGETRKGSPAPPLPFTISNPGTADAMISGVELAGAPGPLKLMLDGSLPRTLTATSPPLTGRLSLGTDEDLDLAQSAPTLKITVDGEQLVYPVTGKVTTPAAYVTPEKLELGTACVGSGISAVVSMINSGTARLTLEQPRADAAFKLQLQTPPTYPASLLAGATATVAIAPAAETPGELSGTLTWDVDAPRSPFVIPVSLAFIDTGTALSPASLTFSTIKVGELSLRYTVTLQNCSTAPVMVTVDGVTATRGGVAAWKVEPSQDARTLAPQDKLTISVVFAPLRQGHHVAQLRLGVDGEDRVVTLEGDGIDLDFKRTSFYACGCNTPHSRSGWPIALAVALVALRRRPSRRRRA